MINIKVRAKNPWFWIGIICVVLAAIGIEPETLTSWGAVWTAILDTLTNPYQLGLMIMAVLAVFVDPTTAGFGDSLRALSYKKPYKGEE